MLSLNYVDMLTDKELGNMAAGLLQVKCEDCAVSVNRYSEGCYIKFTSDNFSYWCNVSDYSFTCNRPADELNLIMCWRSAMAHCFGTEYMEDFLLSHL